VTKETSFGVFVRFRAASDGATDISLSGGPFALGTLPHCSYLSNLLAFAPAALRSGTGYSGRRSRSSRHWRGAHWYDAADIIVTSERPATAERRRSWANATSAAAAAQLAIGDIQRWPANCLPKGCGPARGPPDLTVLLSHGVNQSTAVELLAELNQVALGSHCVQVAPRMSALAERPRATCITKVTCAALSLCGYIGLARAGTASASLPADQK
jgi:hypothetical protein